jgi:hypothetical protein
MSPPPKQGPIPEIARQLVENAVCHLLESLQCSPDPSVRHAAAEVAARLKLQVLSLNIPESPSSAAAR